MPAATESPLPELLDAAALAKRFGVTARTIRRWIGDGTIPAPTMLGRKPVWTPETIARFLNGAGQPRSRES